MKCPQCDCEDNKVTDTRLRSDGGERVRKRICQKCGHRFTTTEKYGGAPATPLITEPQVEKKNGALQLFDAKKLHNSISVALRKNGYREAEVNNIAAQLKQEAAHSSPITTAHIGDTVLKRLMQIDKAAYIRYASVHRDMSVAEMKKLLGEMDD